MFFAHNFYGLLYYFFSFVVFIICCYLFNKSKLSNLEHLYGNVLLGIFVLIYLMLLFFREFDAPDNSHYTKIFKRLSEGYAVKDSISLDVGYVIWCEFLAMFGLEPDHFVDVNAMIIITIFIVSLYVFAPSTVSLWCSIFLLLTSWSVLDIFANTQRQGLSLSIATLSLAIRQKGNIKTSFMFMLVSATIHWTGYFYILFFVFGQLLRILKKKANIFIYLSFILFCLALLFPQIPLTLLTFILKVIGSYVSQIDVLAQKFTWYTSTGVSLAPFVRFRVALELIVFGLLCCWLFNRKNSPQNGFLSSVKYEIAAVFLISSLVTWSEYSFRVYSLFIPYFFVIISVLFSCELKKRRNVFNTQIIFCLSFVYLLSHLTFWRSGIFFYLYGR